MEEIKKAIAKIVEGVDLLEEEAIKVMNEIVNGECTSAQIGSFITALRIKGEKVEELTGFVKVMREKALHIKVKESLVVDTCGTGGDGFSTFNISTIAAFVAAGAGVTIAKHGNRAVSSLCGSADVLKELGVNIESSKEQVEKCINEIGIGFLFAPLFHQAMKYAIGPRREIGIRTVFNIIGPLTNPAGANACILGVYKEELTELLAKVLLNLNVNHAFVVFGKDGLDEISISFETKVSEAKNGKIETYTINPEDFGIKRVHLSEIKGGIPAENAEILKRILKGEKGPRRDIVLLNAAAAIVVGEKAKTLKEGIEIAKISIDSGKALQKLNLLIEYTNQTEKNNKRKIKE